MTELMKLQYARMDRARSIRKSRELILRDCPQIYASWRKATLEDLSRRKMTRTSPDALYQAFLQDYRFGKAPLPWERNPGWVNPYSTETYSACGYEDALGFAREDALKSARDYFRMWKEAKWLKWVTDNWGDDPMGAHHGQNI